eukprot:8212555-Pyramimonas_sp.AAC.1
MRGGLAPPKALVHRFGRVRMGRSQLRLGCERSMRRIAMTPGRKIAGGKGNKIILLWRAIAMIWRRKMLALHRGAAVIHLGGAGQFLVDKATTMLPGDNCYQPQPRPAPWR